MQSRFRAMARRVYHGLPLSQQAKWRLRERLHPLVHAVQHRPTPLGLATGLVRSLRGAPVGASLGRESVLEWALAEILERLGQHAADQGPIDYWITLPFLATGGAERVALNLCEAVLALRPGQSVALLVTDKGVLADGLSLPEGVILLVFDDYLGAGATLLQRQSLLKYLLLALRPATLHNINSEAAWHLILAEGARLRRLVRLHASIFAFQFGPDGRSKIGYAAYFLRSGLPHLHTLTSDNRRFIDDAVAEYELDDLARQRLHVLYQPCRLRGEQPLEPMVSGGRLKVLWAGRLDAEKRMDLLLDVVRDCTWADFHVFGQVVLDDGGALPALPNLYYEGSFVSPLEWLEKGPFDVFLFTSKWEGLPNILLEAGALGLPVIAPTVGGVGELITAQTGFPLPERPAVSDYADALRRVEADRAGAMEKGARLRSCVASRHGWEGFVAAVAALPDYLPPIVAAPQPSPQPPYQVSVIVPCYNQGAYLVECVSSVLLACRDGVEVIIVDDGSTDPKMSAYLAQAADMAPERVRILRQRNQGLSAARNAGLALAHGEFVHFLDADDLLVPGKIDAQLEQLRANPALDVSVSNFLLCDESRSTFSKPDEAIAPFDFELADFLYSWERGFVIPIHCGLFRRRVLDQGFDRAASAKEDWLFWVGLSLRSVRFGYVHGHWAIYRQHGASMRRSYVNMGRAWLQAGLKIHEQLAGREPLFFESMVSWFEQCYRGNPAYREELVRLRAGSPEPAALGEASQPATTQVQAVVESLVERLEPFCGKEGGALISVVVPVYNHYQYLQACLCSLAEQGGQALEVICIDDASPDPRVGMLLDGLTGRLPALKIVRCPVNQGVSAVQNRAVALASGRFIAFLDCDDMLEPGALQVMRACIEARPEVDYFFSDRVDVDGEGRVVRTARYGGYDALHFRTQEAIPDDLFDYMVASHLKVIRRSIYLEVGGCDERFSGVQDWDLALKIAARGCLHYVDRALYRHRVHGASVTSSDRVAQFRKSNIVCRRHAERMLRQGAASAVKAGIQRVGGADFPVTPAQLRAYWREGKVCVADARGPINPVLINFLRAFNGYFDSIEWNDPAVAAALIGYVWDPRVLRP